VRSVLTAGWLQVEAHVVVGEVAARVAEFAASHAAAIVAYPAASTARCRALRPKALHLTDPPLLRMQ